MDWADQREVFLHTQILVMAIAKIECENRDGKGVVCARFPCFFISFAMHSTYVAVRLCTHHIIFISRYRRKAIKIYVEFHALLFIMILETSVPGIGVSIGTEIKKIFEGD